MSGSALSIEVRGIDAITNRVESLTKLFDTQVILDQSAALLFNRVRTRFMQALDADGNSWAPLTPKYAAKKQRKYGGGGLLYASGSLFHSLQVSAVGDDSRAIGTDVPYAKFHQFGTVKMPKRQFLAFNDDDASEVQDYLVRKVQDALDA